MKNNKSHSNSKYLPFTKYLMRRNEKVIFMTFAEIENILGFKLAASFRKYTAGWYGTSVNDVIAFKKSWHRAGYTVDKVSLEDETVVFIQFDDPNAYKLY